MQIIDAGYATLRSGTRSQSHSHPHAGEFHLFTSGSGLFLDQGHPRPVSTGTVFYSRPGDPHELLLTGGQRAAFYWARFRVGAPKGNLRQLLLRRFPPGGLAVDLTARDDFEFIRSHHASDDPDLREAARLRLLAFCHGARARAPNVDYENPHIRRAVQWMEEHVGEKLSLGAISDLVGLDPSYFDRLFKRILGESPMRRFTRLKVETAAYLLSSTKRTVGEIALGLGFSSSFHFSNTFKAYKGLSPMGWRHRNPTS